MCVRVIHTCFASASLLNCVLTWLKTVCVCVRTCNMYKFCFCCSLVNSVCWLANKMWVDVCIISRHFASALVYSQLSLSACLKNEKKTNACACVCVCMCNMYTQLSLSTGFKNASLCSNLCESVWIWAIIRVCAVIYGSLCSNLCVCTVIYECNLWESVQ